MLEVRSNSHNMTFDDVINAEWDPPLTKEETQSICEKIKEFPTRFNADELLEAVRIVKNRSNFSVLEVLYVLSDQQLQTSLADSIHLHCLLVAKEVGEDNFAQEIERPNLEMSTQSNFFEERTSLRDFKVEVESQKKYYPNQQVQKCCFSTSNDCSEGTKNLFYLNCGHCFHHNCLRKWLAAGIEHNRFDLKQIACPGCIKSDEKCVSQHCPERFGSTATSAHILMPSELASLWESPYFTIYYSQINVDLIAEHMKSKFADKKAYLKLLHNQSFTSTDMSTDNINKSNQTDDDDTSMQRKSTIKESMVDENLFQADVATHSTFNWTSEVISFVREMRIRFGFAIEEIVREVITKQHYGIKELRKYVLELFFKEKQFSSTDNQAIDHSRSAKSNREHPRQKEANDTDSEYTHGIDYPPNRKYFDAASIFKTNDVFYFFSAVKLYNMKKRKLYNILRGALNYNFNILQKFLDNKEIQITSLLGAVMFLEIMKRKEDVCQYKGRIEVSNSLSDDELIDLYNNARKYGLHRSFILHAIALEEATTIEKIISSGWTSRKNANNPRIVSPCSQNKPKKGNNKQKINNINAKIVVIKN